MNLHVAMTVFVTVAELNGFAPAARRLGISTSAVSRHVLDLETSLNAQLLRRSTRKLSLTEAGERYLSRARRVLADITELHDEVSSLDETPRGRLRVTATPGFGDYCLAPLMARFAATYLDLSLEMHLSERVVDIIAEGYDIAIRSGTLQDSSLVSRRLTELRYVACASPDYLERRGMPQRPEDLARHDCVHWRLRAGPVVWRFYEGDAPIDVRVTGRFVITTSVGELEGARVGLGIALLPQTLIGEDIEAGRLVPILPGFEPAKEPISFLWPADTVMPRKVRVFIDFLTEELAKQPSW